MDDGLDRRRISKMSHLACKQTIAPAQQRAASRQGAAADGHPAAGLPLRVVGVLQDVRDDNDLPPRGHAHPATGAGAPHEN